VPDVRQPSFASGELSPSLYGASDLPQYGAGARTLRNFLVSKYRTALNRPGTIFLHEVKDSTKLTRLLPFNFSSDQAYAVEVGNLNFRFTRNDGTQLPAAGLMAFGQGGERAKSTDKGTTWSTPGALPFTFVAAACEAANGRLIIVGSSGGSGVAAYTDDLGVTWTGPVSVPVSAGTTVSMVAYNGRRVVAGSLSSIAYSDDNGVTWTAATSPPAAMNLSSVAWGLDRWVVVGYSSPGTQARYSFSYDGNTWGTTTAIGDLDSTYPTSSLLSVCYCAGQFLAAGRTITASVNALVCQIGVLSANWKWSTVLAGATLYGVDTDGVTAVASGGSGTSTGIAYKFDSVTAAWSAVPSVPAGYSYFAVSFSRNYWVMIGGDTGANHRVSRWDGAAWTADSTIGVGGWVVLAHGKGTETQEVASPYPTDVVRELATAQSGDIDTIFHPKFPPKELRRYGEYDWRIIEWYKAPPTRTVQGLVFVGSIDQTGDATHPPKEWQWVVTWEDEQTGRESLVSAALTPGGSTKVALYPDKPLSIRWNVIEKARRYFVYRGRNGEFGYVGTVAQPVLAAGASPTTVDFRDDAGTPVYTESPPLWTNPFQSDLSYPSCGCYFDDRLVVAGSMVQPSAIKGSAVSDYYNFDDKFVTTVNDAFEFTLAARRYEETHWIVPHMQLVVGTSESEWIVSGAGGDALSSESVLARSRSNLGTTRVQPVVVGDGIIHIQNGGQVVRELAFTAQAFTLEQALGWGGRDLSILSQHLLEGLSIVDMAYQKAPLSVVWLVRSDGALLSLTVNREGQMSAWARHDTGGDVVEAVTVIPNGAEDVLFLIVKRTINGATKRYVEMMASRFPASVSVGVFLDCAKTQTIASSNTVSGLSHLEARTVGVLADGTYRGTYTVASGALTFTGPAATMVTVGLPITADFESLDYPEGRTGKKIVSQVGVEYRLMPSFADANPVPTGVTAAGVLAGGDLSHLGGTRKFSDAQENVLFVPVESGWNPGGRVTIRHTQPFPLEIRGITRAISDSRS
jgi:hypothetical protein